MSGTGSDPHAVVLYANETCDVSIYMPAIVFHLRHVAFLFILIQYMSHKPRVPMAV